MRHGMVQDVFGEWVDPAEAVPAAPPVRVYVVDDAMRAADASARAAAAASVVSDWPLKGLLGRAAVPVSATIHRVDAHRVSTRAYTLECELEPRWGKKRLAGNVDEVQTEDVTMATAFRVERMSADAVAEADKAAAEAELIGVRLCVVADCNKPLGTNNRSGRCGKHSYLKAGTAMRDGTVSGKNTLPATREIAPPVAAAAVVPAVELRAVVGVAESAGGERVSLSLSVAALDAFLLRLPVEDKARIMAAVLER